VAHRQEDAATRCDMAVLRTVSVALLVVTTAGAQTRTFEAASVKLNTSSGPPRRRPR